MNIWTEIKEILKWKSYDEPYYEKDNKNENEEFFEGFEQIQLKSHKISKKKISDEKYVLEILDKRHQYKLFVPKSIHIDKICPGKILTLLKSFM
jgi:hypothetical protein